MTRSSQWYAGRTLPDSESFRRARDFLVDRFADPQAAAAFAWPEATQFNWALDWLDPFAASNNAVAVAGPGLRDKWCEISYDELSYASDGVAHRLRSLGLAAGDRVVVESENVCELWAALIGILKCGAVCIPVHFGLHAEQFNARLASARPVLFIGSSRDRRLRAGLERVELKSLVRWGERIEFVPGPRVGVDEPAFGCFTSGTTGSPKLALHSHRTHGIGHLSSLYWAQLAAGRRHLNVSSPGWAKFFWSSMLVPLSAGATVVAWPTGHTTADLHEFAELSGVESICAPSVVLRNLDTSAARPARLADLTSVGEAVDERTRSRFSRDWNIRIREGFGQTEATAILGELPCAPHKLAVLPGYRVRLQEVADAPAAQLQFRSFASGSFLGYEQRGKLVAPVTDDENWQWTGDYADGSVADGTLRLLGRGDDVYRSNGHLVSPFHVESILEGHPLVAEAAAAPVPDETAGLASHAFVVLTESVAPTVLDALRDWVNERLEPEVGVAFLHAVDALPRSVNGKVQRQLLAAGARARSHDTGRVTGPER